ncbi:hypothetical protein PR202_gb16511 [Eleusine coracana subsp. coracana]|uniref:Aladin n=1 Tax=Eleusine coracana subsp. coracana TaxID=191504 RepID=A0AAV5F031_ELECO|nr:hypothetical protein PR202_gb16511 [Eleusine coracana subsp. coracana]
MPSFPPPGAVTICEINRDLVASDALSDDRAKDAYGNVLGMIFSPIPFQPDALLANGQPPAADQDEPAAPETAPAAGLASTITEFFKKMIFPPLDVNSKEPCILTSDHQTDVRAVEWRPNSGKMIAVGCRGGICLWSASYPGNVPFMKSGVTSSSLSSFPRVHLSQFGMFLKGANWDPEGRVALLSFSNSTTLGSIHFSSKPPSLDAHLLPVELPEISSLIVSRGIEKMAWDASGERLAISFKDGNEMYRGLVAVYDVRRSPLISLSLV